MNIFYKTMANQSSNTRSLQVVNKSFELRTATELISSAITLEARSLGEWISTCGRVEWREYLSATFGIYFDKLMNMTSAFGDIFGSAARIFEAIAEGEPSLPRVVLYDNQLHHEGSFGSGLIQNALRWLPELAKTSPNIQKAYEATSCAEALAKHQARIELLASCCVCARCGPLDDKIGSGKRESNKPCLVVIMETSIILCRLLSTLEVARSLFPHLRGLHRLYYRQAMRRENDRYAMRQEDDRHGDGDNMGSFCHIVDQPRAFDQRLNATLLLFTARCNLRSDGRSA